jgi:hypothetical protein
LAIAMFVMILVHREQRLPWPWLASLVCVCAPLVCYAGNLIDQALVVRLGVVLVMTIVLGVIALPYARRLVGHA